MAKAPEIAFDESLMARWIVSARREWALAAGLQSPDGRTYPHEQAITVLHAGMKEVVELIEAIYKGYSVEEQLSELADSAYALLQILDLVNRRSNPNYFIGKDKLFDLSGDLGSLATDPVQGELKYHPLQKITESLHQSGKLRDDIISILTDINWLFAACTGKIDNLLEEELLEQYAFIADFVENSLNQLLLLLSKGNLAPGHLSSVLGVMTIPVSDRASLEFHWNEQADIIMADLMARLNRFAIEHFDYPYFYFYLADVFAFGRNPNNYPPVGNLVTQNAIQAQRARFPGRRLPPDFVDTGLLDYDKYVAWRHNLQQASGEKATPLEPILADGAFDYGADFLAFQAYLALLEEELQHDAR